MKRLLSILLAISLLMIATPSFADDESSITRSHPSYWIKSDDLSQKGLWAKFNKSSIKDPYERFVEATETTFKYKDDYLYIEPKHLIRSTFWEGYKEVTLAEYISVRDYYPYVKDALPPPASFGTGDSVIDPIDMGLGQNAELENDFANFNSDTGEVYDFNFSVQDVIRGDKALEILTAPDLTPITKKAITDKLLNSPILKRSADREIMLVKVRAYLTWYSDYNPYDDLNRVGFPISNLSFKLSDGNGSFLNSTQIILLDDNNNLSINNTSRVKFNNASDFYVAFVTEKTNTKPLLMNTMYNIFDTSVYFPETNRFVEGYRTYESYLYFKAYRDEVQNAN